VSPSSKAADVLASRRPLIAGNWKMNLNHLEAIALTQKIAFSLSEKQLTAAEVVVLPPFVDLRSVQTLIDGDRMLLGYGAQDLSPFDSGAYTGDISGLMLAKLGCGFVLVGHSERRQYHDENDGLVNAKLKAAYKHGLTPILCVGESLEIRESGDAVAHTTGQVAAALEAVTVEQAQTLVVAYEPIWAIGTGRVATPEDAHEVCTAIRGKLGELYTSELAAGVRVLYGGSVKAGNARELLAPDDVDGALVGGASLDGAEFAAICLAALPAIG
jgi:triosephosphate isomerase